MRRLVTGVSDGKVDISMKTDRELVKKAREAMAKAYAPYSHFRVGAVVETGNGSIYTGANVENASSGATVCAERAAIFRAVLEGHRRIGRIAVIGDSDTITYPCGICRQVINEFSLPETRIICANKMGDYKVFSLDELYPYPFGGNQ